MYDSLLTAGRFFVQILAELIPLFFVITFLSGLILEYVSPEKIRKVLGGNKGPGGRLAAILLGFVTPFCSCSTIPMLAGMVGAGVPIGILTTFLFASPYPVEMAVIVLAPLFGVPFAVAFFVAGGSDRLHRRLVGRAGTVGRSDQACRSPGAVRRRGSA